MAVINGSMPENIRKASREIDGDNNYIATMDINGTNITSVTVPDQDLSVAPLSYETTQTENFIISYVYIDFQTPITETCSIWRTTSGDDELLESVDLVANQYVRFVPTSNEFIDVDNGDQFSILCTNANTTGTAKTTLKIVTVI